MRQNAKYGWFVELRTYGTIGSVIFTMLLASACTNSTTPGKGRSSQDGGAAAAPKAITAFAIPAQYATGIVDETKYTISVRCLPALGKLNSLVPVFTTTGVSVRVGAINQASGMTTNDFSKGLTYTVTAADGTTQDYIVTVVPATNTQSFAAIGRQQSFVVPAGVTSLFVDMRGAQGAGGVQTPCYGGKGAQVQGTIAVTPGETIDVYVGGQNGFNGGGNPGTGNRFGGAGNGGGASDIRRGGIALGNRVMVAGGGGGRGSGCSGSSSRESASGGAWGGPARPRWRWGGWGRSGSQGRRGAAGRLSKAVRMPGKTVVVGRVGRGGKSRRWDLSQGLGAEGAGRKKHRRENGGPSPLSPCPALSTAFRARLSGLRRASEFAGETDTRSRDTRDTRAGEVCLSGGPREHGRHSREHAQLSHHSRAYSLARI